MRLFKNIRLAALLAVTYIRTHWRFFLIGALTSLALVLLSPKYFETRQTPTIGLAGDYTISNLPAIVQREISVGLTTVAPDGTVSPAAAKSWTITDSGKTITFELDTSLRWQNGEAFNADGVNYNLKSVQMTKPSPSQVRLSLKEPFAPLLTVVSQPLFKNGLIGLGQFRVDSVNFNGRFVASLTLTDKETGKAKIYKFYPDERSLVTALKLGTINRTEGLHQAGEFQNDRHYQVDNEISPTVVATLFFNTEKSPFDDKSFRQGLTYTLPDQFPQGETADGPIPKQNWVESAMIKKYAQNFDLAKKLLNPQASKSGQLKIELQTTPELKDTARDISAAWQKAGLSVDITTTDVPNPNFDVYLAFLELPTDPDQYSLWHSTQPTNISHYKSAKVDKLLEEGRRTLDQKERKSIYSDFLRAITEDVPAAFLFYPKLYTVTRN